MALLWKLHDALGGLRRSGGSADARRPPRGRAFTEFPQEVLRPAVFSILFWSALSITCLSWAVIRRDGGTDVAAAGVVPTALSVVALAAVWLVLPWDPRARLRRKLAAPAFLVAVFVVGRMLGGSSVMFYPLAFANAVFLLRFGRGIAYAAAVLAVIFVDALLILRAFPDLPTGTSVVGNALAVTVLFVPVAVFMIGVSSSILEADRRREEKEVLLEELEGAHAELKEYAVRTRELAVSEERTRMAREIHDSLGHHLTAINLRLEHARRSREKRPEEAWEEVGEAKGLVASALSEVRRAVRALGPLDLEERTGTGALDALARSFAGTGREISFRVEGAELALPEEAELALYRAMQEGLTNALKHSNAGRVIATMTFGDGGATLTIADDGAGAPEGSPEGGFGLRGLGERAEKLGGTLRAENIPDGKGFVLEMRLPVDPKADPATGRR
jgi:signal transduction histidine kinase